MLFLARLHASSGLKLLELLIWFEVSNIHGSSAEVRGISAESIGPQSHVMAHPGNCEALGKKQFVCFYISYMPVVARVRIHVRKVRPNRFAC